MSFPYPAARCGLSVLLYQPCCAVVSSERCENKIHLRKSHQHWGLKRNCIASSHLPWCSWEDDMQPKPSPPHSIPIGAHTALEYHGHTGAKNAWPSESLGSSELLRHSQKRNCYGHSHRLLSPSGTQHQLMARNMTWGMRVWTLSSRKLLWSAREKERKKGLKPLLDTWEQINHSPLVSSCTRFLICPPLPAASREPLQLNRALFWHYFQVFPI